MDPVATSLIERLELQPHPEGGYYRELFRSTEQVTPDRHGLARSALTTIYFLLVAGEHSHWHRLLSDEVWHFIDGAPLELFWIDANLQSCDSRRLGAAAESQEPVAAVPAGCWQAARTTGSYTLAGCTVGPGFDFADFALLRDMPQKAEKVAERFPDLTFLL